MEDGQKQCSDLEAVHVGIGTQNDLAPVQFFRIELRNIGLYLLVKLDAASDNAEQVGNDVALEDLVVGALDAVKGLTSYGDYCLKFCRSAQFTG